MKPLIILAVILAAASAFWWYSGDDESGVLVVDDPVSATTASEVTDEDSVADVEVKALENEAVEESAQTAEMPGTDQAAEIIQTGESTEASPFDVVNSDEGTTEPVTTESTDVAEPQQSANVPVQQITETGNSASSLEPVEVPSSYPVTDAAKYFIPKEERAPGRLGGPPPLDFPGGPSDPNRETDSAFQPPTAPGQ